MTSGAHRKVVTVVFCDVVGSTTLGESVDPETLQALLARYFERMSGIVESHGGTVEKFIGDAVMAVFGVPVAHEDDALRACRAAVEMRDALPELGVEGRIGINTGEVLTGTEERLATGDAVNVAARLEQAAESGEVLIGAETLALVALEVDVGERRLLELKGKAEPVAAHPVLAVREAAERSHASRFVGRERELQELADAWDRALAGPGCELVTVIGDPGVGKSRLAAEALGRIDAKVVRGRCLSYGEGITYWPVVEVVKQLDALPEDEEAAKAIRSLLRETETAVGTDEIAWAFRRLLEEQAPLVVCFDDIQWGEETFLELVESTALLSTGAPLLLLCMARPELLDRRPGWPTTLRLAPLAEQEAGELVGDTVPDEVRTRIIHASGGNPLFVTEMLALAGESDDVEVPATLRALLAARLDQLDSPERRVLERGSVEGELFHRGTVQALAPEEEVTPRLAALVRRDLVRPDRPQIPRQDAYRFRHLLIRDTAYEALPKATRADLHRRFAAWLDEHGQGLVELDELLGYHLEQAAVYLAELGRPEVDVALAAGDRLAHAGRRAWWRGDSRAAASLLQRALTLTRPHRLDVHLEVDLAESLWGEDLRLSGEIADAAVARAEAAGDRVGTALARVVAAKMKAWAGQCPAEEVARLAGEALPLLESAGDEAGLASAWEGLALVANGHARFAEWAKAGEAALIHHRRAGRPIPHTAGVSVALALGPVPATEALAALDALLPERPYPGDLIIRALLLAMLDRPEDAWAVALPAWDHALELGHRHEADWMAEIAHVGGDLAAAAAYLEVACKAMEETGNTGSLSSSLAGYGRVLCQLGRYAEAAPLAERGRGLAEPDDVSAQTYWRLAQALVDSSRGDHDAAAQLANEAVAWIERSDSPHLTGDAYDDLGEVLEAAGRRDEAAAAWRKALGCYEQKGIVPLARRIRERLDALEPA
ncbi:MAG TPA: adenylate/guanylate cyclase domain-containing protein [Gaiellaceae bacterium]|nr:adenylate/guanylate cyclase domain-containing protein [Gaiellaceae bacterium]